MMDPKLKALWIKDLLSGKFRQGRMYLQHEGRNCCLGVLGCRISKKTGPEMQRAVEGRNKWGDFTGLLNGPTAKKAGLTLGTMKKLVNLNDERRFSFKKIAEWIKEEL